MEVKISKLSNEEFAQKGINRWPVWEKEASTFDWYYDSPEQCYILDGEVTVETSNGNYDIKAGDFVEFPQGLKCVWHIKKI